MGKPKGNRRLSERERGRRGGARALATFSSPDGALIARGMTPANLCGPLGHRGAAGLYAVLGFSALVLPVAMGAASLRLFQGATPRITLVSAAAYAVLTLSIATLAHLALGARATAPFPAGGPGRAAPPRAAAPPPR